jgi:murein tripeptide amidase MpaA
MIINGAHHARELTTISMAAYTMLTILHGYEHQKGEILTLLDKTALVFIPVVNVDGFARISDYWHTNKAVTLIRKNRQPYTSRCFLDDQTGVDLNRNYPYMFGLDPIGSSEGPCEEDYRGPTGGSEPEV